LRHVKVQLFLYTVYHIFMIYLPLLCRRPEVLQGYALPCPRWLTLGCKCSLTFKRRRGQKSLYTSGLEGSVAPL